MALQIHRPARRVDLCPSPTAHWTHRGLLGGPAVSSVPDRHVLSGAAVRAHLSGGHARRTGDPPALAPAQRPHRIQGPRRPGFHLRLHRSATGVIALPVGSGAAPGVGALQLPLWHAQCGRGAHERLAAHSARTATPPPFSERIPAAGGPVGGIHRLRTPHGVVGTLGLHRYGHLRQVVPLPAHRAHPQRGGPSTAPQRQLAIQLARRIPVS